MKTDVFAIELIKIVLLEKNQKVTGKHKRNSNIK